MVSKRFQGTFIVEWEDQKEECHIVERTQTKFLERLNEAREEIFKQIPKGSHVKTRYHGDFAELLADRLQKKTTSLAQKRSQIPTTGG